MYDPFSDNDDQRFFPDWGKSIRSRCISDKHGFAFKVSMAGSCYMNIYICIESVYILKYISHQIQKFGTIIFISCLQNLDPGKRAYDRYFWSHSQNHKIDSKRFNQCLLRPREGAKKRNMHCIHFAVIIPEFQSSVTI